MSEMWDLSCKKKCSAIYLFIVFHRVLFIVVVSRTCWKSTLKKWYHRIKNITSVMRLQYTFFDGFNATSLDSDVQLLPVEISPSLIKFLRDPSDSSSSEIYITFRILKLLATTTTSHVCYMSYYVWIDTSKFESDLYEIIFYIFHAKHINLRYLLDVFLQPCNKLMKMMMMNSFLNHTHTDVKRFRTIHEALRRVYKM